MKRLKEERALTLVELVFVIAIIVILASIFLPLAVSKLGKADDAAADASIQEIAAALASFYDDLRHFPTCDSATSCNPFPDAENKIVFLAFGDGRGDLSANYPTAATGAGNWDLTVNDEATPARNNGANHLVANDPNTDGAIGSTTDYAATGSKRWRGPYLSRAALDPWGRTFIAYVGAMEKNGQTVSGAAAAQFGWILSAGPNHTIDTLPGSSTLQGDDRGFIFHTE